MKILCLNGGGTSGVIQNLFLERLERKTKKSVTQLFDMIYGVSVGSILGAAYIVGRPTESVDVELRIGCEEIFGKRDSYMPWKAQYSADKLHEVIRTITGNVDFSDIDLLGATKFACIASKISGDRIRPEIWKSWDKENGHVEVRDALCASSAAPTYFDPYSFAGNTYTDGGMIVNNPTMCAIADALHLGEVLPSIYVLNLQTGIYPGFKNPAKKKGLIQWATDIYKVGLYGCDRMVEYQAHELLGFRNHVVLPDNKLPIDCLNFSLMEDMADELWEEHKDSVIASLTA